MLSTDDVQNVLDNDGQVLDTNDHKIGKVGQVFLDDTTEEPAWVSVTTGLFGGAESFVPLDQATLTGDDVAVPSSEDTVTERQQVSEDVSQERIDVECDGSAHPTARDQ